MNIASVLVLLQAIVSLYANPQLAQNASLKAQVDSMAASVVSLADQVLSQPADTQLGIIPTSTVTISVPSADSSTLPVIVTVTPPVQQPSQPVLGATPTSTPVQLKWGNYYVGQTLTHGMVIYGPDAIANSSNTPSFQLHFISSDGHILDSATLTINGQSYDLPLVSDKDSTDVKFSIQLATGTYPYSIQVNSGNNYALWSDSVTIQ